MKSLLVSILFLTVISIMAEDTRAHRNFLIDQFKFDPSKKAEDFSGNATVVLEPFIVTSSEDMSISEKNEILMEREFNRGSGFQSARSDKGFVYVPPTEYLGLIGESENSRYVLQRDVAVKYLGGIELFNNANFYLHGSLNWRINKDFEIGIKSIDHGVKALVVRYDWEQLHRLWMN